MIESQELIVLTSPPASGKTHLISNLLIALGETRILVISPLRALADECRDKWGKKVDVMTPEEWIYKKSYNEVVVFDEFHLFFYWGGSFRPLMWEMFFEICLRTRLTIFLTATMSEEMRTEVRLFGSQFDEIFWVDHGNQELKYLPKTYVKAPSLKWILEQLELSAGKDVTIVFCQYREEVFALQEKLSAKGFSCLTCVGGESSQMRQKLESSGAPDFIISTTVLSHGVNLPSIGRVCFTYAVGNLDFWIQMVARGGRRGEDFHVVALERPWGMDYCPWKNFFRVLAMTARAKLRTFFSLKSFDFS